MQEGIEAGNTFNAGPRQTELLRDMSQRSGRQITQHILRLAQNLQQARRLTPVAFEQHGQHILRKICFCRGHPALLSIPPDINAIVKA